MDKDSLFFLGFALPPFVRKKLQEEAVLSSASAALFGWKVVRALETAFDVFAAVVPQVNDFPACKRLFFCGGRFERDGVVGRVLPFVNLPILKHVTRLLGSIFCLFLWRLTAPKPVVVVHGLHSAFLAVGRLSQLLGCRVVVMVTDLPSALVFPEETGVRAMLRRMDARLARAFVSKADAVIALAPRLADWANVNNVVVLPGVIDELSASKKPVDDTGQAFVVTYTGMLSRDSGVKEILDAMRLIPFENLRLQICGDGALRDEVVARAHEDSRIEYFGVVSAERAFELLSLSSLLINPRPHRTNFSDSSFPSKLLDYLATDTPILTTQFASMPEWMLPAVVTVSDGVPALAEAISDIYRCGVDRRQMLRARKAVRKRLSLKAVGDSVRKLIGIQSQQGDDGDVQ